MKKLVLFTISISLYLVIWTSYSPFLEIPFNSKRLAEGFLLLLGAILICTSTDFQNQWMQISKGFEGSSKLIVISLGVLFLFGAISAALSNYPGYAFLEVGHFFLLLNLLVLYIIIYQIKPLFFEYIFLSVISVMAALYLINVAISYVYTFFISDFPIWPSTNFVQVWFQDIGYKYPEPFLNFVHIRYFNHIQTWTLPLITLMAINIPKRYWAVSTTLFAIACGWWMLVFAADARGTMLAAFLALGFIFVMYRKRASKWIYAHSLSAGIGLGLYLIFFKLFQGGGRTILTRYSDSGRFDFWSYALKLIWENPIFGVGPMHYANLNSYVKYSAPHNAYLQVFSEWGIPAGVIFLVIIFVGSYYWYKSTNKIIISSGKNSNMVNTRVALTASLIAALIHGFFTNILNTPISQILMILILAWMIGISLSVDYTKDKESIKPWYRYCLISANLLAVSLLIWSYTIQVPNLDSSRQQYLKKTQGSKLYPRYWDQGIIGIDDNTNELKSLKSR